MDSKKLFFAGVVVTASGLVSPPLALVAGVAFAFLAKHPYRAESHSLSKFLLQASVVGLGFGMNLNEVIHAGRAGFLYTAMSISAALVLGVALGKALRVSPSASFLITCGTAICGGSAIAAIAPITEASEEDMAVSLGTVFTLNAVALLVFPVLGQALHFSQEQFGLWAALAIHDTSSVVGAAAKYGPEALRVGTAVKLARALWIIPLAFATSLFTGSREKLKFPWFILFFVAAAGWSNFVPHFSAAYGVLNQLGRAGLTVTLFLIGAGLSKETFRQAGTRPMAQGVALWVAIATLSLWAIRSHLIGV